MTVIGHRGGGGQNLSQTQPIPFRHFFMWTNLCKLYFQHMVNVNSRKVPILYFHILCVRISYPFVYSQLKKVRPLFMLNKYLDMILETDAILSVTIL